MHFKTERAIILTYFFSVIAAGTLLLSLPSSWSGTVPLKPVDALFTSVSAVCVTGLITVDTALFSGFGQTVILLLIQFGGLGIISFSSLYLVIPSKGLSLKGSRLVKEYYLDAVEYEPEYIIRQIIIFTFAIETAGMLLLYPVFKKAGTASPLFTALFHSVSAFCNAGFSTFSNSLESFKNNSVLNLTVIFLIISGGLGFVLIRDILKTSASGKKHLAIHTKIVLLVTVFLILTTSVFFFFAESRSILEGRNTKEKILISLFQSVSPRTAGFNTIPLNDLSLPSKLIILPLMFIGAAPGSTAGGIKVTTFFIIALALFKKMDRNKNISIFRRNIKSETIFRAFIFVLKASAILFMFIMLLSLSEYFMAENIKMTLMDIVFECFSAFGTVGLSLGITSSLTVAGKLIIIAAMLTGRFGLLIIAMDIFKTGHMDKVDYPEEEVLIG